MRDAPSTALPQARIERELSPRAVLTGVVLGILLTPSNVYAGLRIGWSFNMSIIALLVGFTLWQGLAGRSKGRPAWTLHESNINQTVASAAASIVSGGLVAPIPAYTLLTGHQLDPLPMMAWVFSVSFLGIWIAWYLRPALLDDHGLKFPEGMATLETLQQIYRHGHEAMMRIKVLCSAALLSGLVKWIDGFVWTIPRWAPSPVLERLTFTLDPSLMLVGFGGITREIQANLFSYPYDFDVWDTLMATDVQTLRSDGAAIERKHQKDVAELVAVTKRRLVIAGHDVPVASLPYTLTSDAGHLMAQGEPFAACYWDTPDGRVFSLRSTDEGLDVSEIAKQYGGGGHRNASGFRVPFGHELTK